MAFALVVWLAAACSQRNENSAQGDIESDADSVESVAPTSDGMPQSSSPANAGSPPDSAAAAVDSVSNQ